jgi:hypothetical protein
MEEKKAYLEAHAGKIASRALFESWDAKKKMAWINDGGIVE